jgi:hypothetical protein
MNLSFNQLIILIIIGFLFFGDFSFIIKNFNLLFKKIQTTFNFNKDKNFHKKSKFNHRKKGT